MTNLTREQIEEARDAILDSINATEQEFACNKAQHDLLGVRRREFLNALCDMALRAAKPEHPVDYSWVCNECGSYEFTMAVSEDDLSALACSGCGCDEFHKAPAIGTKLYTRAADGLVEVATALVKWSKDYPSSRIYNETEIRRIAKEIDAIAERAARALGGKHE